MSDLKSKLLAKNRKVAKTITVDIGGEPVELSIIKTTFGDRLKVIEAAQAAGEIDADGKSTSARNGARMAARMMAASLYRDGHPIFGVDDLDVLLETDWFEDVSKQVGEVFNPDAETIAKK